MTTSEYFAGGNAESRPVTDGPIDGGVLDRALKRWDAAADRLRLTGAAKCVGSILLLAELDSSVRHRLLGNLADKVAPRRAELVAAAGARTSNEEALEGLLLLETRQVVAPYEQYVGPWLLGEVALSSRVRAHCLSAPTGVSAPVALALSPRLRQRLQVLQQRCVHRAASTCVVVRGCTGSGRDAMVREVCHELGTAPFVRSARELRAGIDALEPELSGRVCVWDARRCDVSPDDYDVARRWLARSSGPCIAVVDAHQDAPDVEGRTAYLLDMTPRDLAERRHGWDAALAALDAPAELKTEVAQTLAERNGCGVGTAIKAAELVEEIPHAAPSLRAALERGLEELTQPSSLRGIIVEHPNVPLARVVLSEGNQESLARLLLMGRTHSRVPSLGRAGVKALFAGPPGTGKTLAARALACELECPLFRVDLAAVVSKWVGETEKNLRNAMEVAQIRGAVLLFDEGDALFGKRGEVSRGADRYANVEVAHLLQALEAHEGIVLVTTNLRQNIDEAFERRFDMVVEFAPPTRAGRVALWRHELGEAGASLSPRYLEGLARSADLHGGAIAAAARFARLLALDRGTTSTTEQEVNLGVRGEFLKMGSTVQASRWSANEHEASTASPAGRKATTRVTGEQGETR